MSKIMYGFIIDTEQYAGNFARQLCAYLTGQLGECEVGEEYIDPKEDYSLFSNALLYVADESDTERPVSIYPTPGIYNNGHGFNFRTGEEDEAVRQYKIFTNEYYGNNINRVEGYRERIMRGDPVGNWTLEDTEKEINRYQKMIDDAENITFDKIGKHRAFCSIIIYFENRPTPEQIEFIKNKAKTFNEFRRENDEFYSEDRHKITVTGFRLTKLTRKLEKELSLESV